MILVAAGHPCNCPDTRATLGRLYANPKGTLMQLHAFFRRIRGIALFLSALGAFITTGLVTTAPGHIAVGTVAVAGALATNDAKAALSFVTSLRQGRCNLIVTTAGANAVVEARTGSKPATTPGAGALPAATGTLLATMTGGTVLGTCTNGSLDFDEASFTQNTASHVAGTPGYFRLKTSGGTAIADIDVCGSAPCLTFTGTVATGQTVTLTNIVFAEGNT